MALPLTRKNLWCWGQLAGFDLCWGIGVWSGVFWAQLPLLLIHLWLTPTRSRDLALLPLALVGFAIDLLLWGLGVIRFNEFPYWLLGLWIAFIWTLPHGMEWLKRWPIYGQALLGALMGPLAYFTGANLGGIDLPLGKGVSALVLALLWGGLLPLLVRATGWGGERMSHGDTLLFSKWTRESASGGETVPSEHFLVVACRRNAIGLLERVTLQNVKDLSEMEVERHELESSGRWHRGWD